MSITLAILASAAAMTLIVGVRYLLASGGFALATRLRDKLIHTDALMNKANWQTGVAGFAGVAGLGFGWWWADSAAAILIAGSIIFDGWTALKIATSELIDGIPHELGGPKLSEEAKAVSRALKKEFPDAHVLMRETGRYIRAELVGATPPADFDAATFQVEGLDDRWRLESISFRH